jgi:hypothetical protein
VFRQKRNQTGAFTDKKILVMHRIWLYDQSVSCSGCSRIAGQKNLTLQFSRRLGRFTKSNPTKLPGEDFD